MTQGTEINSIVRALSVIEAINQSSVTSVDAMHKLTGISKPTLIRLLGTLTRAGFLIHVSRRDGYALTEKVLRLSAGFHYHDAIVDIARPLLDAFTRKHKWQLSLATLDSDCMLIRYNTRHLSPFATDKHYLNRRVRILASTMGRAYLAYCDEIERGIIMKSLAASGARMTVQTGDMNIDALIETVRRNRYAMIERPPDGRVSSFAIPLLSKASHAALGSMAVFYFGSVMTESEVTGKYLDEMYQIAGHITSALNEAPEDFASPVALKYMQ